MSDHPEIVPGSRRLVFHADKWRVGDPKASYHLPAVVVRRYGKRSSLSPGTPYSDLVDVVFDGETEVSQGHFTDMTLPLGAVPC